MIDSYLFVFARLLPFIFFIPAFGEKFIPHRIKIALAFWLTLVVTPLVTIHETSWVFLLHEAFIGAMLGISVRFILSSLETAGHIIGFQTNLSSATVYNPAVGHTDAILGTFLTLVVLAFIFATDLYVYFLHGIVESFFLFKVGQGFFVEGILQQGVDLISKSFALAFQLSLPFIVVSVVLMAGLGLMNRMMQQVQVFFVSQSLQVGLGLLILWAALPSILTLVVDNIRFLFKGLGNG